MESNLNRARYGLNRRPSSSMSSFANHSPESVSLYTLPSRQDSSGIHTFKHRQPDSPTTFGNSKGHARVFSETSVPSSLQSSSHTQEHEAWTASNPMDTDAAAVDSLGEWDFETERNWFWSSLNRDGSNIGRINTPLEPLHEDKPAPVSFDPSPFASSPLSQNNQHHHFAPDQISSGSSSLERESPTAAGVSRARSTDQMRDLRDQMQDLKGRISSLKQRAQEDSLRRRSLQSLRTPSPFTAAEQWYTGVSGQLVSHTRAAEDQTGQEHSAQIEEGDESGNLPHDDGILSAITSASDANKEEGVLEPEDHAQPGNTYQNVIDKSDHGLKGVSQSTGHNKHEPPGTISEPHLTQELDPMDDGFQTSAEEDSLMKLPDDESDCEILNSPVGERHEDRPDAFDYEHFYLHSSMGHYGRAGISRTSSHSSIYSVETTKPSNSLFAEPAEVDDISNSNTDGELYPRHNGHLRQNSGESVSTVATFATATEGREHEEEWFHRRPVAGSWESDYPSKRNFNMTNHDTLSDRSEHAPEIRVATAVNKSPSTNTSPSFSPHTPTQSPPAAASSPSSSMDLLSALSSLSPTHNGTPGRSIQLNDRDKELVERLIQSLSKVCTNLHIGTIEGGKYENRVWRRRLDAARRVLDGETNGEAF